jgi:HSP20 family protein
MLVRVQYPRVPSHVLQSLFLTDNVVGATKFPAMDIAEREDDLLVTAELPGVKKDAVKVTFENGILTLEGKQKAYETSREAKVLLNEMQIRDFSRSIRINIDIDASNISAELEDGILRVVLPKAPESKVRSIPVK